MKFILDPLTIINLLLSATILIFGLLGYKKSKHKLPLYVGISFGLFGVSHLVTLLGFKQVLAVVLLIIRMAAYLIIIFALKQAAFK